MGKNRHSKDRLFLTATEWKNDYGGKKSLSSFRGHILPFDHCALSLTPFISPACTPEGVVFEFGNLFSFVRKHKCNPVTGRSMTTGEIIKLNMAKNADDHWHCPVLFKVFNNNSHIVTIRGTGNVYSFEAVNELNIKSNNYSDLLTGDSFNRSDIITLQNPEDAEHVALRDVNNFKYLQTMREDSQARSGDRIRHNPTSDRVMTEFKKLKSTDLPNEISSISAPQEYIEDVSSILRLHPTTEDVNPGHLLTNQKASGSLTSTSVDVHTQAELRPAIPEEIREARWRAMRQIGKKAYVQIQTNYGALNFEIHCDWAPRTSWNFLTLCTQGYYTNTFFHRLVPGFILQGGDPTGTGSGGQSVWGRPFRDEFDSRLIHDQRGVLSMANSGENTNKSQFFITLQPTPHLNLKHSIFGKLVGGSATLDAIEAVAVMSDDIPSEKIMILGTQVFVNPIQEADEMLIQLVNESKERVEHSNRPSESTSHTVKETQRDVGRYLSATSDLMKRTQSTTAVKDFMKTEGTIVDESQILDPPSKRKRAGFENW